MKIKYKLSAVWLILAVVFIGITIYVGYLYGGISSDNTLSVIVLLPALVSIYYFFMPKINYIRVKNDLIYIHKSFIVFNFKIKTANIHHCNVMRKDLVIFTKDEKVYPIHLDWIKKDSALAFVKYMKSQARIEEEGQKSFDIKRLESLL